MALSGVLEFQSENRSNHAEHLTAMVEIELGRHFFKQTMALLGQGAERGVIPEALESFRDLLQERYLRGGKKWKQMLEGNCEGEKDHFLDGGD